MGDWSKAEVIVDSSWRPRRKKQERVEAERVINEFIESDDDIWVKDFTEEIGRMRIEHINGDSYYMCRLANPYRTASRSLGVNVKVRGSKMYLVKEEA